MNNNLSRISKSAFLSSVTLLAISTLNLKAATASYSPDVINQEAIEEKVVLSNAPVVASSAKDIILIGGVLSGLGLIVTAIGNYKLK